MSDETTYFALEDGQTSFSFGVLSCGQRELRLRSASDAPSSYEIVIGFDNNQKTVSEHNRAGVLRSVALVPLLVCKDRINSEWWTFFQSKHTCGDLVAVISNSGHSEQKGQQTKRLWSPALVFSEFRCCWREESCCRRGSLQTCCRATRSAPSGSAGRMALSNWPSLPNQVC